MWCGFTLFFFFFFNGGGIECTVGYGVVTVVHHTGLLYPYIFE